MRRGRSGFGRPKTRSRTPSRRHRRRTEHFRSSPGPRPSSPVSQRPPRGTAGCARPGRDPTPSPSRGSRARTSGQRSPGPPAQTPASCSESRPGRHPGRRPRARRCRSPAASSRSTRPRSNRGTNEIRQPGGAGRRDERDRPCERRRHPVDRNRELRIEGRHTRGQLVNLPCGVTGGEGSCRRDREGFRGRREQDTQLHCRLADELGARKVEGQDVGRCCARRAPARARRTGSGRRRGRSPSR